MKILITKAPGDIIVEKKEQILGDWDGDGKQELMGVDTGSHDSGRDQQISVPDSSFVFSDTKALKIKDKEVLKQFGKSKASTPATLANQYDLQKYTQNPNDDKLTNKTKQMMYDNSLAKLSQIATIQEDMKKQMQAKKQQKQMKMGGYIPQYPWGGQSPNRQGVGSLYPDDNRVYPSGIGDYRSPNAGPTLPYYGYDSLYDNQRGMANQKPGAAWFAQNIMAPTSTGDVIDNQNGYRTQFLNAAQENMPYDNNVQSLPYTQPTVSNAPQVPIMSPVNTPNTAVTAGTTSSAGDKKRVRLSLPGMNPDQLGDLALGLKAGSVQKFKPWEPPVTAVIPEATFVDPTRELAANSEQAAMAYNAANQSANSKAARSAGSTYQGQAIKNAADILGRYNNQNVQIANQANQQTASITNQMLEGQRERAKSLNSDMFNANRLYQGEMNQLSDEMVKRAYQKEDSARNRAWINQTNPYYQLNKRGFPVFNSEAERGKFLADMQRMQSGQGPADSSSYKLLKSEYDKAVAAGLDDSTAQEAAWKNVYGNREKTTYGPTGNIKSKSVSETKLPKQKLGGFTSTQLRKFIENRIG